ncbi:MAG: biotin synthase BioB [Rhodospirillaceae bacterium]|nr:MAG: biotin synthase BioB [Rhodospirillaceae bacterium]
MTSNSSPAPVNVTAPSGTASSDALRHDWQCEEILSLFDRPFNDLLFEAHSLHRRSFDPNRVQISTLLSIKTGGCPEDCKYCAQSARYDTDLEAEKLLAVEEVVREARKAKAVGATRFCMGAAWRNPKDRDLPCVLEMIREVKAMGLETCATLGMVTAEQAAALKEGGLDYYNHNVDTSEEFYGEIITTRTYQDRLDTLANVRAAGMKVCAGGILGMGEARKDRAGMLMTLANLPTHPESVPINLLIRVAGTPFEKSETVDPIEFVRTVAVARILMPQSVVRLSAGREHMTDEMQALCFFAGANSIFYGEKLLTAGNPEESADRALFERLGLKGEELSAPPDEHPHR